MAKKVGTVTTNLLNIRTGAGTFANIIMGLKRGETVEVLEAADEQWSKVKLADGRVGFAATEFLNIEEIPDNTPVPTGEAAFKPYKVAVTTQQLNVRSGAGTEFRGIATLKLDNQVTVLAEAGEWYRVDVADGQGYIHSSFTRKVTATPTTKRGYLIEDPELMSMPLIPDKLIPTEGIDRTKRPWVAARIWNENGRLIEALAQRYDIPVGAVIGVIGTESAGKFFDANTGKLTVRFEVHQFHKYWGKLNQGLFDRHFQFQSWKNHKFRSSVDVEWDWVHTTQTREHEVLAFARMLDDTAALKSISMGGAQVMGFNYARLGYESVQQMYDAFARSSHAQILGLFDFVKGANATSDAIEALRKRDFFTFASHYNGSGLEAVYEERMGSIAAYFDDLIKKAVPAEAKPVKTTPETSPTVSAPIDAVAPPVDVKPEPVMAIPMQGINFREKPNGTVIGSLPKDVPVKIAEDAASAVAKMKKPASDDQWVQLENAQGKKGYAAAWYLKPSRELTAAEMVVTPTPQPTTPAPTEQPTAPQPEAKTETPTAPVKTPPVIVVIEPQPTITISAVPTQGVNLREKPSTTAKQIGTLKKGIPVKIIEDIDGAVAKMSKSETENQWINVEDSTGLKGYAAAWLLTPSRHFTQAGVSAHINKLSNVAYPAGYEYLWSQQKRLGLPNPFDVLPVQIDTENELVNMQVNGYGPNTFAFWYWQSWYSRIGGMHNGYDFIVKTGTPLLAVSDGIVIKNWVFMANRAEVTTALWCFLPEEYRDSKGRRMMSNVLVAYGHCSSNKERQHLEVVKAGDVIALSGTPAGTNTNDHLHYEVHLLQGDMNLPNPRTKRRLLSVYERDQPLDNNTPWNPLLFYSKRLVNYQVHQGNTIGFMVKYPDYPTLEMMKARGTTHLPKMDQFTLGYYRYGIGVIWNKPKTGIWQEGIIPTEMLEQRLPTYAAFEPYEAKFLTV
jgi:uncharacterized protein YgiM (DUF1202 family)